MKAFLSSLFFLLSASVATSATMPGVGFVPLGTTAGFASSIAIDSTGTIYYTTTNGGLYRFDSGISTLVAHVTTEAVGDSGLLGMALRDDHTAVVHYVTVNQTADVVSLIDLDSGAETVLHTFIADITLPGRPSAPEHHGGNPTVAEDGTIYVGIGDYGGGSIAAKPEWNGGKIWRIATDGTVTQFARGFRNPFDLVWDAARQRIVTTDNGAAIDDEIDLVTEGGYYGWPYTVGNQPPIDGATAPAYVFPKIVAPTGMVRLNGRNPLLPRGYLIGAFLTKSIYWVPDVDAPQIAPIPIISGETSFVIDVAQAPGGELYFTTDRAIYRIVTGRVRPMRTR
jgi:glucose/arabinose dehydrogenase